MNVKLWCQMSLKMNYNLFIDLQRVYNKLILSWRKSDVFFSLQYYLLEGLIK